MDRFLLHVFVNYPSDADEEQILRLVRGEEAGLGPAVNGKIPGEAVFAARAEVNAVTVSTAIERYFVALVAASRRPGDYKGDLQKWIQYGASPRGTLALDRTARAHAWLQARDHVLPEDVRAVIHSCLRHRIILSYEANADGVTRDAVVDEIVKLVALP
jgi:MoxR-like ATPase